MDLAGLCLGFELSDPQAKTLAGNLGISEPRLREAQCLMSALAMVWYRANPRLARAAPTSADQWYEDWCQVS